MRRAAHLSNLGRVSSLRPLVAVVISAARLSRNVRISGSLMPYHHKAPQHERARHASRIVVQGAWWGAHGARRRGSAAPRGTTDWPLGRSGARSPRRETGAAPPHARAMRPARDTRFNPYSHLATTYLDIINKIIVRHELVCWLQPVNCLVICYRPS